MRGSFENTRRWVIELINPARIRWGLYALAGLTGLLFLIEVLCPAVVWMNPITGTCRHFITLEFIESATALSFSLTAFLLVGVAVISAFAVTRSRYLSIDEPEFRLRLGRGGDGGGDAITITEYEDIRRGDQQAAESGVATWHITSSSPVQDIPKWVHGVEEPVGVGLGGRHYAVRDLQSDEGSSADKEQYHYRVKGRVESGGKNLRGRNYWGDEDERRRIHWLLREGNTQLRALSKKLRRAVSYSVSASVLGVLIQGYPWGSPGGLNPWLLNLPQIESAAYILFSYLFTFIFIGMVSTSVGLLDVMAKLLDW